MKFHSKLTEVMKQELIVAFEVFSDKYKAAFLEEVEINPGDKVVINHACIWNEVSAVGKEATVIVSDNRFCVVVFGNSPKEGTDFYRCEDVTPIKIETDDNRGTQEKIPV